MPDKVYKERKAGQGIIVYGWCPSKNKAIALQVDENGRLVIDPEDLDTRYLRLDGLYPMTGDSVLTLGAQTGNACPIVWDTGDIGIRRIGSILYFMNAAGTAYRDFGAYRYYWYYTKSLNPTGNAIMYTQSGIEVASVGFGSGADATFNIARAGDIIPVSTKTKSLGSVTNYWNQAFVDAILCSNSIDMHPTPGDAVIYFKHDGAANEASLRYDKVNKRLELWIDGAIVGYCNAALGWVNGAP